MTHIHYKASPEIVKTTFEKLVIVAMNNRCIEYLGGLESTAANERTQPEEPQRAINLVSIPQNFLKREISLTFLFLPSGTILVNVNYILPPIITNQNH